ncbi:MAG: hypothetical protein HGA96_17885 [Desulfobulbaceae bacterium]|nr:hypothetical protein [Desulfobulbaceae bacterium]
MDNAKATCATIDEYLATFPVEVQARLREVRETIRATAPAAVEKIAYGIPTFYQAGNLVHFAGYENHLGFYPTAGGMAAFAEELAGYKHAKGSVQFPHHRPLPLGLIGRIVTYRLAENLRKAANKKGCGKQAGRVAGLPPTQEVEI